MKIQKLYYFSWNSPKIWLISHWATPAIFKKCVSTDIWSRYLFWYVPIIWVYIGQWKSLTELKLFAFWKFFEKTHQILIVTASNCLKHIWKYFISTIQNLVFFFQEEILHQLANDRCGFACQFVLVRVANIRSQYRTKKCRDIRFYWPIKTRRTAVQPSL